MRDSYCSLGKQFTNLYSRDLSSDSQSSVTWRRCHTWWARPCMTFTPRSLKRVKSQVRARSRRLDVCWRLGTPTTAVVMVSDVEVAWFCFNKKYCYREAEVECKCWVRLQLHDNLQKQGDGIREHQHGDNQQFPCGGSGRVILDNCHFSCLEH